MAARVGNQVPAFLSKRTIGGLEVCFDDSGLADYTRDQAKYDEIFGHAASCHSAMLARYGQCAIIVMGEKGSPPSWKYGYDMKIEQDGFDLGDPKHGIAYYGNLDLEHSRDLLRADTGTKTCSAILGCFSSYMISGAFI